ncbi:MAG: hypothetical protein OJF51_004143 [Nitrospira sp.]|jgi:hypothetical protein|nr:MAG: hypothetical protein OJF51_004143 [Nitrospira sp.]
MEGRRTVQVMLYPGASNLMLEGMQFPRNFTEGDIAKDFNPRFTKLLDELRITVQQHAKDGLDLKGYDLSDWWNELMQAGQMAYNTMLDQQARQRLGNLEKNEWDRNRRGLRFTFRTPPEYCLFWEMLYDSALLEFDKKQFWGFRYPLGRTFWNKNCSDRIDIHDGILSAIHNQLPDSLKEVEQLTAQLAQVSDRLGRKVSLQLLDKALTGGALDRNEILQFFHSDERFQYGIVHFACHCTSPDEGGASQASLCLTGGTDRIEIPLEWIIAKQAWGFRLEPLVFLNACESATPTAKFQTISFPTGMLDFGAGSVVATACVVPDRFAAAFAREFYKRLLLLETQQTVQQGQAVASASAGLQINISEALLQTRLYFFDTYDNPLGLAYGLYAVSDQQFNMAKRRSGQS